MARSSTSDVASQAAAKRKATVRDCRRAAAGLQYSSWVGMCLDEFVRVNPDLPDVAKGDLLRLCPTGRRKEGKQMLQMLPQIAKALRPARSRRKK